MLLPMAGAAETGQSDEGAVRQHRVIARMIGHRLLLSTGDSLSRVMPIVQEGEGHVVRFDVEFGFNPEVLVAITDSVMQLHGVEDGYLVEVQQCSTREVVHSFQVNRAIRPEAVACSARALPKDCYRLFITISAPEAAPPLAAIDKPAPLLPVAFTVAFFAALGLGIHLRKRAKVSPTAASHAAHAAIGRYLFDRHHMLLRLDGQVEQLTSKEADLLAQLLEAVNTTVERDILLREVWGDEGVYVGRTLDVFISRLRKKLEADPTIRIVNVRGVGYRLVVGSDADATAP